MTNNPDPTNPQPGDTFTIHPTSRGGAATLVEVAWTGHIADETCVISLIRNDDGTIERRLLHAADEFKQLTTHPTDLIPESFWVSVYYVIDDRIWVVGDSTLASEARDRTGLGVGRHAYPRQLHVQVIDEKPDRAPSPPDA